MTKVGAVAAKTSIQVAKIGVAFATAGTAAAALFARQRRHEKNNPQFYKTPKTKSRKAT